MTRLVSLLAVAALTLGASTVGAPVIGHAAPAAAPIPALAAVDFVDVKHGWVAGNGIYATKDGGKHWTRQYAASTNIAGSTAIVGLAFGDMRHGWAWGDAYAKPPLLLHTKDGGAHWTVQHPSKPITAIQAVGAQGAYAISGKGPGGSLLHTTDGGAHWKTVKTPLSVTSACFADDAHGWAVALEKDTILRTTNGGRTWTRSLSASADFRYGGQIGCASATNVWALLLGGVGMNQVSYSLFHTTDGGAHWKAVVALSSAGGGPAPGNTAGAARGADGEGARLDVVDADTAYLVSGCPPCGAGETYLGSTHDGGRSWHTSSAIPHLHFAVTGISFAGAKQGWLASSVYPLTASGKPSGVLLSTANSGIRWTAHQL
ncbi:MAG: YCF48-related protein [Chloroflexota bacterium]